MSRVRQAAVLGSPIQHSLSPVVHRAAYAAVGLDWQYRAIEVDESHFAQFWESLDDSWVGLSLTMPLKTIVLPFLDHISDRARQIGAVNTVVFEQGRALGHNTDVTGMIRAIDDVVPDRERIRSVAIIGGGATARSAVAAIIDRHAPVDARSSVADRPAGIELRVFARRNEQARELAQLGDELGVTVDIGEWSKVNEALMADLVVSCLPGHVDLAVDVPPNPGLLLDVAYDPWPPNLSALWRQAGGLVVTGADLLLGQAIDQVELMTGRPAPIAVMRSALIAALDDRYTTTV